MNEYGSHETAALPPALHDMGTFPAKRSVRTTSKTQSALRIVSGAVSILIGFWSGSGAVALISMSEMFGPRFVWLGYLLGFAALSSVGTGFVELVRHARQDLRIPSLSMAFAAVSILTYLAVFVAFPLVTPMLGGLIVGSLGIILIALTLAASVRPADSH